MWMILNMLVSHPKVDIFNNPNLDDSECVFMTSTSGCLVQSIFGRPPKLDVLCNIYHIQRMSIKHKLY